MEGAEQKDDSSFFFFCFFLHMEVTGERRGVEEEVRHVPRKSKGERRGQPTDGG